MKRGGRIAAKPVIVLVEITNVVDAIEDHGTALDAEAESITE